jgi:hypothetical protein
MLGRMLSWRAALGAAIGIALPALAGCAREVSVHIQGAELARAEDDLRVNHPGMTLETAEGAGVRLDAARVVSWQPDGVGAAPNAVDGTLFGLIEASGAQSPSGPRDLRLRSPDGRLLDATWRFRERDTTDVTTGGAVLAAVGGAVAAADLIAFALTAGFTGPEPRGGPPDATFRREEIVLAASAGVAVVGAILCIAGNARFRAKHGKHLGEGSFRGLAAEWR